MQTIAEYIFSISNGQWFVHENLMVISVHTFYSPLASWASPYFQALDLAIVELVHLFQPFSAISLSYWVSR